MPLPGVEYIIGYLVSKWRYCATSKSCNYSCHKQVLTAFILKLNNTSDANNYTDIPGLHITLLSIFDI